MQTLYHALKELEPVGDYVDARFYTNQALPLSKELIHDLYGDTISGSVTRMEKFAGCAFSHFMQYGLRLQNVWCMKFCRPIWEKFSIRRWN